MNSCMKRPMSILGADLAAPRISEKIDRLEFEARLYRGSCVSNAFFVDDHDLWRDLDAAAQAEIRNALRFQRIARGETLIEAGAPSQSLYIVNFGLFEVVNPADGDVIAQIGKGQLIGEMGFFSGEARNATVIAARDSAVLAMDRPEFDRLAERFPQLQSAVTRALAKRLGRLALLAREKPAAPRMGRMRVVAVTPAGPDPISPTFIDRLRSAARSGGRTRFLTAADTQQQFGRTSIDPYDIANWLADIERDHDFVVCLVDAALTDWTRTALRAADEALFVASGASQALNDAEHLALELFPPARRRLVRVHARRVGAVSPTAPWLRLRDVAMTHHVSLEDDADFHSLMRFLSGRALGYVASGGGALGVAHIGVYDALQRSGIAIDIVGGSSVGSAMTAAFAQLAAPQAIDAAVDEIFVRRGAFKKLIIPRYGMLDHTHFDEALQKQFGSTAIEDLWKPCFAVAADLTSYRLKVIRAGPVWEAVRASCAIPGVLPPFFDDNGHMLVDGGVVDNVPVATMNALKRGPNIVVDLCSRAQRQHSFRYQAIPGRWRLLAQMLNPLQWGRLPPCPGPASVIQQSLFGNIREAPAAMGPQDVLLRPPSLPGATSMNWTTHGDAVAHARDWTFETIARLRAEGHPLLSRTDACAPLDTPDGAAPSATERDALTRT